MKNFIYIWMLVIGMGTSARSQSMDSLFQTRPEATTCWYKKDPWNRFSLGGNVSIQPGPLLRIDLAPIVGYRFPTHRKDGLQRWLAGVGGVYIYTRDKSQQPIHSQMYYGGRVFIQYGVSKWLALRTEGEGLNMADKPAQDGSVQRRWIYNPLIGGGITIPLGSRSMGTLLLLYNLNYTQEPLNNNLYSSPWVIRTGVMF